MFSHCLQSQVRGLQWHAHPYSSVVNMCCIYMRMHMFFLPYVCLNLHEPGTPRTARKQSIGRGRVMMPSASTKPARPPIWSGVWRPPWCLWRGAMPTRRPGPHHHLPSSPSAVHDYVLRMYISIVHFFDL
jgi:hypothetical protein